MKNGGKSSVRAWIRSLLKGKSTSECHEYKLVITTHSHVITYGFESFSLSAGTILDENYADMYHIPSVEPDGRALNKNDYKELYKVIGDKFNSGDEKEEEFRVPDLRAKVLVSETSYDYGKQNNHLWP